MFIPCLKEYNNTDTITEIQFRQWLWY